MKTLGKTYLIEAELPKDEITECGIILPVTGSSRDYEAYMGKLIDYGTGFTQEQKKDLIPIGSKVIMDYGKKAKRTKLLMNQKTYYIYNPEDILAIINEEE